MVLTADGAFEMHVVLGDTKAEEFAPVPGCPPCDGFIEANLFVKGVSYPKETVETDPFGEEFTQAWPVTPYKLRVENHSNELRWLRVYVDGEPAYESVDGAVDPGSAKFESIRLDVHECTRGEKKRA
ncbi:serine/threonine kinase [Aureococcus anophagefferens]|nr:serine/threonine kinase [Aureococcus anophagefferens]